MIKGESKNENVNLYSATWRKNKYLCSKKCEIKLEKLQEKEYGKTNSKTK